MSDTDLYEHLARIESTMLGYEDHGILTAFVHLDYGGAGQGAGGYSLDSYSDTEGRRVAHAGCGAFIAGVLQAVGVRQWEDLKGKHVYALTEGEYGVVRGLRPLPFVRDGREFLFASIKDSVAT